MASRGFRGYYGALTAPIQLEGHFEAVLEDDQMYLVLVAFSSESTMVNHRFEQPPFKGSIC